jgi:pimeloyl-ACP methyl ester carboxylesterase
MRSVWLLAAAVAAGATLAACTTHVPLSAAYRGPAVLPVALQSIEPSAAPLVVREDLALRSRPHFDVRRVTLPSNVDPARSIEFEYYDPDGDLARTPVIVVLPIFNGQLIVTRYFARYFAAQGFAALVVDRERDPLAALDRPDEAIRANIAEYERVLDWIGDQPGLDPSRIGVFGISLGAMDGVMLTALDNRVDALVAAMAGGDLASLAMNTNYRPVMRTVDDMLESTGTTRASLEAQLDERIRTDPLTLAPYVDAGRVLMILARTDVIVPFSNQEELRESMGAPESLYLPTGHRTSIVFFPKVRATAYEFFARRFAADAKATAAR